MIIGKERLLVKIGGSVEKDKNVRKRICKEIANLSRMGYQVILVHGGGKEIDEWLQKLGHESRFHKGLRVTDAETMKVVEMVLCGRVNKEIVTDLSIEGISCIGLSGKDDGIISAKMMKSEEVDLGFVGEIQSVRADLLDLLLDNEYVPVLAPVGMGQDGSSLNINADIAAAYLSARLNVDRFILLTDVAGIYKNFGQEDVELLSKIQRDQLKVLVESGEISGGMIPKLNCCIKALEAGVQQVTILNGMQDNILRDVVVDGMEHGTTLIA